MAVPVISVKIVDNDQARVLWRLIWAYTFASVTLADANSVWGIHMTKRLSPRSLLLDLAPHKVRFFRISLFIPNGICSNKAQSTRK